MDSYLTLDHELLDLTKLTADEQKFLEGAVRRYKQGAGWVMFMRWFEGRSNPLVDGDRRITTEVRRHPLYRAVQDMTDRIGIIQGTIAPREGDIVDSDPLADRWITATEAAELKDVSRPSLHDAINRSHLIAKPIKPGSNRLAVSIRSLER